MLRPGRKLSKIAGISKHVFRNMNDFFFWLSYNRLLKEDYNLDIVSVSEQYRMYEYHQFVFSDVISCRQPFIYHFCLIFFLTSDAYPVKFLFFLMSDAKIDSNNK